MGAGHSVQEHGWPQYRVQPDGRLSHLEGEEVDVEDGNIERIRIVGFSRKAWFCDPLPEKVSSTWKLWAQELRPLVRLQWDPGEYCWSDSFKVGSMAKIPLF